MDGIIVALPILGVIVAAVLLHRGLPEPVDQPMLQPSEINDSCRAQLAAIQRSTQLREAMQACVDTFADRSYRSGIALDRWADDGGA